MKRVQRLKTSIDSIDLFFGVFPVAAGFAAFVSWASLIVRAIRGEEVKEDWRVVVSTGAAMSTFALVSATRVRELATQRAATVEMRELVREAAADAQHRDQLAAEQQVRLTPLTRWLVALAALTLVAAIVTLVAATVSA
jgi:hypothetical protein